jgi:diguanylate cyclase (GGDEF)-like protein
VWYLLLIAVVNLAVGFCLAVVQGRRVRFAGLALGASAAPPVSPSPVVPAEASRRAAPAKPVAEPAPPVSEATEKSAVEPASAFPAADAAAFEASFAQAAELDRHAGQYQQHLADIDDQMRRAEQLEPEQVASYVEQLEGAHREFLSVQEGAERIALPAGAGPELEDAHARLLDLWQQQCREVLEAQQSLAAFEPQGSLPDQCEKIIHQNHRLLEMGHKLRDTLGEEMDELGEGTPSRRQAPRDEVLEGLMSREQLEAFLADWWTHHADGSGQLSAMAVDVDELARVNQEWGPRAGDHVLQAVVQVLLGECGLDSPICRFTGDSFLVLLPNVALNDGKTHIERARQRIEHTHFERGKKTLRVTVSCGITEASPGDGTAALLGRIEAALAEAKRYGRNRTFAHEGKYPTPVMPPSFELEDRNVEL